MRRASSFGTSRDRTRLVGPSLLQQGWWFGLPFWQLRIVGPAEAPVIIAAGASFGACTKTQPHWKSSSAKAFEPPEEPGSAFATTGRDFLFPTGVGLGHPGSHTQAGAFVFSRPALSFCRRCRSLPSPPGFSLNITTYRASSRVR